LILLGTVGVGKMLPTIATACFLLGTSEVVVVVLVVMVVVVVLLLLLVVVNGNDGD